MDVAWESQNENLLEEKGGGLCLTIWNQYQYEVKHICLGLPAGIYNSLA